MFYLIGVAITFFLVLILASKKAKSRADVVLLLWLIVTGFHLLLFYLQITKINLQYPFLLGLEIPIPFLHAPFLYLYIKELTNLKAKSDERYIVHFLPYILGVFALIPFFKLANKEKIAVYINGGEPFRYLLNLFFICFIISAVFYTVLSVAKLLKYKKSIANYFSDIEKINLQWLMYLTLGLSVIWLVVITASDDKLIFSAVVVYIIFIGYFGIKQVGIFTNNPAGFATEISPRPIPKNEINIVENAAAVPLKYEKSGLTEKELSLIHKTLIELMDKEKCYKAPELTLPELAKKLAVHPNTLSQVINSKEHKNFYDYINIKRIEEFKAVCNQPENQKFTLLALAFECGFNSKTSFNRNFKKATQLSPSQYLKQKNICLK